MNLAAPVSTVLLSWRACSQDGPALPIQTADVLDPILLLKVGAYNLGIYSIILSSPVVSLSLGQASFSFSLLLIKLTLKTKQKTLKNRSVNFPNFFFLKPGISLPSWRTKGGLFNKWCEITDSRLKKDKTGSKPYTIYQNKLISERAKHWK